MPGALSQPSARQGNLIVSGKTALSKAKLKSREGMGEREWSLTPKSAQRKPNSPKNRDSD